MMEPNLTVVREWPAWPTACTVELQLLPGATAVSKNISRCLLHTKTLNLKHITQKGTSPLPLSLSRAQRFHRNV